MRRLAAVVALLLAAAAGVALSDVGSPGTVTACATASVGAQTIAVNGDPVSTVPAATASDCETATIPTVTQTVAPTTTIAPVTTTAPATTTAAAPAGSSLQQLYNAAAPGSTVLLAGSYGDQTLIGTKPATFQAAPGATVSLGKVTVQASNVRFAGLDAQVWQVLSTAATLGQQGSNVLLDHDTGHLLYISGATQSVNVLGGSYGGSVDAHSQIGPTTSTTPAPDHTLIEGASFHDVIDSGTPGVHTELFQSFGDPTYLVIRRSRFYHFPSGPDTSGGILLGGDHLVFENNMIGSGGSGIGLGISTAARWVVIQYNSSPRFFGFLNTYAQGCPGGGCGPYIFTGNYMGISYGACWIPGASFSHNVWAPITGAVSCAGDKQVAATSFPGDPSVADLHIGAASVARDAGDPNVYPATDFDGDPRVAPPDAGADQYAGP